MFASIYLGMQYRILGETVAKLSKRLGAAAGAIVANDTGVKGINRPHRRRHRRLAARWSCPNGWSTRPVRI